MAFPTDSRTTDQICMTPWLKKFLQSMGTRSYPQRYAQGLKSENHRTRYVGLRTGNNIEEGTRKTRKENSFNAQLNCQRTMT